MGTSIPSGMMTSSLAQPVLDAEGWIRYLVELFVLYLLVYYRPSYMSAQIEGEVH